MTTGNRIRLATFEKLQSWLIIALERNLPDVAGEVEVQKECLQHTWWHAFVKVAAMIVIKRLVVNKQGPFRGWCEK